MTLACRLSSLKVGSAEKKFQEIETGGRVLNYSDLTHTIISFHSKVSRSCLYNLQVTLEISQSSPVSTRTVLHPLGSSSSSIFSTKMHAMNSLVSIAVLLCASAMANAGGLLPYGYGAYPGYYGLPFVPGVAPYAAPAVPAA
ncbi:hypothetical protein NPIL_76541, partial [Nephila pilipes]